MNLLQLLDVQCADDIYTVVSAVKFVLTLIQWAIPCALIVYGTIDMFKAMTSGDDKVTKEITKKFSKRLIYAAVAFLIPFIISLTFTFVGRVIQGENTGAGDAKETYDNFFACWKSA